MSKMWYETLDELAGAYRAGGSISPLVLDNDTVDAYEPNGCEPVFSRGPGALLRELLDLAGIPWEEC